MTKSQIKAELRRSACEDEFPWDGIAVPPFHESKLYCRKQEYIWDLLEDDQRTFFLLVAEAL